MRRRGSGAAGARGSRGGFLEAGGGTEGGRAGDTGAGRSALRPLSRDFPVRLLSGPGAALSLDSFLRAAN